MEDYNLDIEHEFDAMLKRLKRREFFAFSRFNDGEMHVLKNQQFTCEQWQLTGDKASAFKQALAQSLCYQHPDYIIGIPCSCREDTDQFRDYLFSNFELNTSQMTFSTLFVNAMHRRLQNDFIPAMTDYPIILVANEKSNLTHFKKCGFDVKHFVPVSHNAWQNYKTITKSIQHYTQSKKPIKHLFLFSAGPVANILIPAIHKTHPENTYIDIGSSLDQQLGLPKGTRNYLQPHGWKKLARCVWHRPTRRNQITCSSISKSRTYRAYLKLRAILTTLTENML